MDTPRRSFRFDRWWGLAGGIVLAIGDTILASRMGFRFAINGHDATLLTGLWFGSSFATLGYGIGWLAEAGRRERAQAAIIRAQVEDEAGAQLATEKREARVA